MAELMRDSGPRLRDRLADRVLAVGAHAGARHWQGLWHLGDQARQVLGGRRQEALGPEDLAGEAVAQDPEDLVADLGLPAVDGQDDATLVTPQRLPAVGVGAGPGVACIGAVQEVGDGAHGHHEAVAGPFAVDFGEAAVFGVAEAAEGGRDVESELRMGPGEVGLGLGPVGSEGAGSVGVVTALDRAGQPEDAVAVGDGAEVVVVGMGPVMSFGAVDRDRSPGLGTVGFRARSLAYGGLLSGVPAPFLRAQPPVRFASLVS